MSKYLLTKQLSVLEIVAILLCPVLIQLGHSISAASIVIFAHILTCLQPTSGFVKQACMPQFSPLQMLCIVVGINSIPEFTGSAVFLFVSSYVATEFYGSTNESDCGSNTG